MLMNVQSGAVALLEPIDNRNGNLGVGLRSITYMVCWYNVGAGELILWWASSNNESRRLTRPHSTTVEDLIKLLEEAANDRSSRLAFSTKRVNGYLHSQSRMDGRSRLQMGCSHSWVWMMVVGAGGLTVEHTMVTAQSTSLPQSHSMCTGTSWIQQKMSWIVPNRPFSPVLVSDAMPLETFIQSASCILNSNASVVGLQLNWR